MGYLQRWTGVLFFCASAIALASGPAHAAALRLSWQDTSSTEKGFKIERLNGSAYVEIASVAANVVSYSDTNLTAGATYCYRVRAFNDAGASAPSNAACSTASASSVAASSGSSTTTASGSSGTASSPTNPLPASTPAAPTGREWTDYLVSAKIRSTDNGDVGLMFRYQDSDNYYRFSWSAKDKVRRLEKRVGGVFQVLARDRARYTPGQTYAVQISARGTSLSVDVDGKTVLTATDAALSTGTIALYSHSNSGSYFSEVRVQDLATGSTLLEDNFADGNSVGWSTVDEGNRSGPSIWQVQNGAFVQSSNIRSRVAGRLGTYALYTRKNWADYRVTVKVRSSDDDFMGVLFRFQDRGNYYRLLWGRSVPGRKLWKRENGVFKLIAEDAVPYNLNQTYSVEIIAQGSSLKVNIDGSAVFSAVDESFPVGAIALYSSYNEGTYFDDVLVEDLSAKTTLLWDDFNDGSLAGWKIFDDPGTIHGPSKWAVANGAVVQSSNIGADDNTRPGTFLLY